MSKGGRPITLYCPSGHLKAGDNLRIRSNGRRECIACQRKYSLSYHRKQTTLPSWSEHWTLVAKEKNRNLALKYISR